VPVHPQVAAILESMGGGVSIMDLGLDTLRLFTAAGVAATAEAPEVSRVENRTVPTSDDDIAVRLYWPSDPFTVPGASAPPLLVWFHGGGFVIGNLDSADPTARDLCQRSGAVVASVEYPLAPESPFPAAPEACWSVTSWLADHAADLGADPARVAVGGDSAGANLATVTALLARDRGGPHLVFQLLVYPGVDFHGSFPSKVDNGSGYLLTTEMREWFHQQYFGGVEPDDGDARATPLHANLERLPPALVVTAEFDPLRDEGEAYAERLQLAGVDARAVRYAGMIHGFFGYTKLVEPAREAMAAATAALRTAFSS